MVTDHVLITGGAGFIGSNLAFRLLAEGRNVHIYDNLSRRGGKLNLEWLKSKFGEKSFRLTIADLADMESLRKATRGATHIYHLAGQVAVTTSVLNPRKDFEDNALGTFNVLEAARLEGNDPIVLYSSTNKVYGGMEDTEIIEDESRYRYADLDNGVSEEQPLDFHSPYGCSKGAGDQYVRDYARIYGLRTVVLRQSCIYGYRQFGVEDQGWVAWFMIAAQTNQPIMIYGDGKQVRDLLYIDDLIDAYEAAVQLIEISAGKVYNIGGGPMNTLSVWSEFGPLLEELHGESIHARHVDWRPGDQLVYISDISKARKELNWEPKVSVREGCERLYKWVFENPIYFTSTE